MKIACTGMMIVATSFAIGCGPSARGGGDDTGSDGPDASICTVSAATETSCNNGFDEDCDGFLDCFDVDCINHTEAGCPSTNCGELTHPESTPLALPDDGSGSIPYETTIELTGFSPGQRLDDLSKLLGVCVTMEHSWLRDLEISARSPDGTVVMLQMQLGNTGSEVYMGVPNDFDEFSPIPGTGYEYCWTPTATNLPMLEYCNANPSVHDLPPGDYQASGGFSPWQGATLNGNWFIRVRDLWGIDNGFIFDWTIRFDPSLVTDCSEWPTE
jgi:subtilisin-like proprotein convertase family protein